MKRMILKIFFLFASKLFPRLTHGASVLMYHSIGVDAAFFTVTPAEFKWQLEEIKKRKLIVLPLSELIALYEQKKNISNCISITFDDGYKNVLTEALPLLRSFGYRASIFIVPSLVGKTYTTSDGVTLPIFSIEEFKNAGAGDTFELLPHTFSHRELPQLEKIQQKQELENSFTWLQEHSRKTEKILSYPRGKFTSDTVDILEKFQWKGACTVQSGLLTPKIDRYQIPRNSVDSKTTRTAFRAYLSNAIGLYAIVRSWIF